MRAHACAGPTKSPRPFIWTKAADEILETIAEYRQRITSPGH